MEQQDRQVKIDHESDTVVIDGIQVYINSIHTIASKFFKSEENEFLDTSEPFNEPQVLDQLKKLQKELDEMKSFQEAPTKVNVTVIEPDKVISQPIL
jgi:type II secretory pathway component GspD/PulD (secretin)